MKFYQIPANAIRLTAKGVAKTLNATLELFAVLDSKGEPTVAATSSLTGQSAFVDKIYQDYQTKKDMVHIGKSAVKALFDKDMNGGKVLIEGYNKEEWSQAEATLIAQDTESAKAQIAAIADETPIKIWTGTTSYGIYGSFQMEGQEKLSERAKKLIEKDVLLISQKKAMKFEYESVEDAMDEYGKPKCATTFGEFRKVAADLRAAKQALDNAKDAERAAKFAEAKATGQPVQLSFYTAPEHETPLKNDGEGDIVTCCEMAMPDGSIQWEYHHNY